jgi:arylformamidase
MTGLKHVKAIWRAGLLDSNAVLTRRHERLETYDPQLDPLGTMTVVALKGYVANFENVASDKGLRCFPYVRRCERISLVSAPRRGGSSAGSGLPAPLVCDFLTREQSRSLYAPGTEFHIGKIEMVANTGTYLDTPAHRYEGADDLADVPIEAVADLPGVCVANRDRAIGPDAFAGADVGGRAVLIATGWDRHWGTEHYGADAHPCLTAEAAQILVAHGAALVGIDSVNIDDTSGGRRPAHSTLLAAGIPVVEHLTGLDVLVGRSFRFTAAPVKVRGMGTFPVRAFAVVQHD